MMLGQNLRVHVLPDAPQQRGRALDVGEEESERFREPSVKA